MIQNFDNWKCRCSALGKIMPTEASETPKKDGSPRKNAGKMSKETITYLQEVFIGEIHGVQKEAYGRQLDKGVACEDDSFKMINELFYPGRFIAKIKEPTENEYIKGTADCITPDEIIWDAKNAWDRFTFGKAEFHHNYLWQGKGYMYLYKKEYFRLIYTLINLPEHMVMDEERKMFYTQRKWTSFNDTDYLKACEELRAAHNYDNLPVEEKFKVWELQHSKEDDERIKTAVIAARTYLNQLLEEHKDAVESNKKLIEAAHHNLKVA